MAVHTIGPFIGTHEILRTRRAAIRRAAEYSVPYPQGENSLNDLREGPFDVVVLCSAFDQREAARIACLVRGEYRTAMATFGAAQQGMRDCGGMDCRPGSRRGSEKLRFMRK